MGVCKGVKLLDTAAGVTKLSGGCSTPCLGMLSGVCLFPAGLAGLNRSFTRLRIKQRDTVEGQCFSPYRGLALLADTDMAPCCWRIPVPASYTDLTLSAHTFLPVRNEFASEHSRTVHPRALKSHTWAQSPPWHLTDCRACAIRGAFLQEAKALTCEREAQLHVAILCSSQSECQTAKSEQHAQIRASGS